MEATIKNDYSKDSVNIPALIELHSKKLMTGMELNSSFVKLPIMRDFLVFTYTSSEDVRKEYWPRIVKGLSKYSLNPAAEAIWNTLFPGQKGVGEILNKDKMIETASDDQWVQDLLQLEDKDKINEASSDDEWIQGLLQLED